MQTPGVYIVENHGFPKSIIPAETSIPVFIGYTEKASMKGRELLNIPTRINSFIQYIEYYGKGFSVKFTVTPVPHDDDKEAFQLGATGKSFCVEYAKDNRLLLYPSLKLFYANGGGPCYIVSVGTYEGKTNLSLSKDDLLGTPEADDEVAGGLKVLEKEVEPTIVVVPDAVNLPKEDCYEVYDAVLRHCSKMQNRVGILDVHEGYKERESDIQSEKDVINSFRKHIGSVNLMYGAAYYPWLETNIIQQEELSLDNLDDSVDLKSILTEPTALDILDNTSIDLHKALLATSPTYVDLMRIIGNKLNLLPPSSAMAGIYASVDNTRGVWKAPANVSVNSVVKPSVKINHEQQENLNVDAISGKSINAIRTFPGIGTLVWGGRTLDGNSLDWRYINVRRTMIMLEQSIKNGIKAFVFEPNEANTWVMVKTMIVTFLTDMWKKGALAGSSPEDAFAVNVGLGSTMTANDILEGKMNVTVKLAVTRPAEFIVVTFQQQMQKS